MEIIKIDNFSFTYPDETQKALDNISLFINSGEFITVCGKSGCGKSTFLRSLKPPVAPSGNKTGKIYFCGENIETLDERTSCSKIGFVLQNPDSQIVTDKVWHELAFGLESLGLNNTEIRLRVSEMASFFGIGGWFHKKVSELSGGQKQILNLASVMAMHPDVIILDEPTSQLDPVAAQEFLSMLSRINKELGITVILSEHRLEEVFPVSDKIIVMENGKVIFFDSPVKAVSLAGNDMFTAFPAAMRVYASVPNDMPCPVSIRDGRTWLDEFPEPFKPVETPENTENTANTVIDINDVYFRYEKNAPDVLSGVSAQIKKGEVFAIMGENGSGKSTLLSVMGGRLKANRGKIRINGKTALLCQNPGLLFVKNTVYEDLFEILPDAEEIEKVMQLCKIGHLRGRHPYDLSGGEMQKAAIAMMLLQHPDILLLDEPTKGLDAHFKINLADIFAKLKSRGVTIVMVSHDVEFCAAYADRCALVFDGNIIGTADTRTFFAQKSFYTTAANRMARGKLKNAVLTEDIIFACGGKLPEKKDEEEPPIPPEQRSVPEQTNKEKRKSDINLFALIMFLIAVPLTIFIGTRFLGDRKYYFTSLMIIFETMLPFAMVFEKRKPRARELVMISVLCGIAVAGRAAFYMLPQIKPMLAVVVIAGACLGGETGFLVGALSAFISNFFMGQGPWTPWQMFALGIIGFFAGILFKTLPKKRLPMCIFGGVTALIIYGGIMDPASVILSQNNPTAAMFAAAYASGIYFNLLHAAATVIFLFLIAEPMVSKIERIKRKYEFL